jgi:hypothetical protein
MRLRAGAELVLGGDELRGLENEVAMDHGGKWKSSVLMGAREDLVDLSRFGGTLEGRIPDPLFGISKKTDSRYASLELGRRYMKQIPGRLVEKARELLEAAR